MRTTRSNTGLYVGLGCLAVAVGPLLVFGLLQSVLGLFPGNNGLGLGLWLLVAAPIAFVVLVVGVFVDDRSQRRKVT